MQRRIWKDSDVVVGRLILLAICSEGNRNISMTGLVAPEIVAFLLAITLDQETQRM